MHKFALNFFRGKTDKTAAPIPAKCAPNAWSPNAQDTVIDGVEDEISGANDVKTLFGVKSYLNYFYVSPTTDFNSNLSGPPTTTNPSSGVWYLLPPPPSRRRAARIFYILCNVFTILGLLLLLCGAFAIVVGYCWPTVNKAIDRIQKGNADEKDVADVEMSLIRIAVDQDEYGNFYIPQERFAELLHDPMHTWKMSGFCMFAVGASLMAFSLLIASLFGGSLRATTIFTDASSAEPPIRIYPGAASAVDSAKFHIEPTRRAAANRISPTSGPVPAGFDELARVQPPPAYAPPMTSKPSSLSPSTPAMTGNDELLLLDGVRSSANDDALPLLADGRAKK